MRMSQAEKDSDFVAAAFAVISVNEDRIGELQDRLDELDTFGRGPHVCPGAPLARLLLEVAVEGIVRRTRRLEIAGEITMTNWPEYGPLAVPIKIAR